MKLSTKGRYGVRLMIDLALHYGEGPILLKDIAKRLMQRSSPPLESLYYRNWLDNFILFMIKYNRLYFFPLISFDQTFLSKRKVWLPNKRQESSRREAWR